MSIFDRFISRDAAEPEREPFHPIPYKKRFAELDKSGQEAMERYPEDRKTVEDFLWALQQGAAHEISGGRAAAHKGGGPVLPVQGPAAGLRLSAAP